MNTSRSAAVDMARIVAIFGIIILHFTPQTGNLLLTSAIHYAGRWSVAFFFLVSGYFYAVACHESSKTPFDITAHRCFSVFLYAMIGVVFCSFAAPWYTGTGDIGSMLKGGCLNLYYCITGFGFPPESTILWFLRSMIQSIVFLYCFLHFFGKKPLPYVLFFRFILGGLGQNAASYSDFIPFRIPTYTTSSLYCGFPFMALGYLLYDWKDKFSAAFFMECCCYQLCRNRS